MKVKNKKIIFSIEETMEMIEEMNDHDWDINYAFSIDEHRNVRSTLFERMLLSFKICSSKDYTINWGKFRKIKLPKIVTLSEEISGIKELWDACVKVDYILKNPAKPIIKSFVIKAIQCGLLSALSALIFVSSVYIPEPSSTIMAIISSIYFFFASVAFLLHMRSIPDLRSRVKFVNEHGAQVFFLMSEIVNGYTETSDDELE